jgi:hypothetical protein
MINFRLWIYPPRFMYMYQGSNFTKALKAIAVVQFFAIESEGNLNWKLHLATAKKLGIAVDNIFWN